MLYNDRKKYAEELVQMDKYVDALGEYSILLNENRKDKDVLNQINFLWKRVIDGNYDFEPVTAEQFVMRGVAKYFHGEFESALADYNTALKMDPNSDYALHSRALTYKSLGRLEFAIADLKVAIDLKPLGEYYDNLGDAYSEAGNSDDSLIAHKKAIELAPEEPIYWYNYGCELCEANKLTDAIIAFDKAIELNPDYEDAIANRQHLINHGE